MLRNEASNFKIFSIQISENLISYLETAKIDRNIVFSIILKHIDTSDYATRLMEIAMHSLMQAMQELQIFSDSVLKPLSQTRSANKNHGNIADIELLECGQIVEAWDAKYGQSYLRDEIEELSENLQVYLDVLKVGFVTSIKPERFEELEPRCREIEKDFGVSIEILTFEEWVKARFNRVSSEDLIVEQELAARWLKAYTESLAQLRLDMAPIDEPCYQWLLSLNEILKL